MRLQMQMMVLVVVADLEGGGGGFREGVGLCVLGLEREGSRFVVSVCFVGGCLNLCWGRLNNQGQSVFNVLNTVGDV